MFELSYFSDGSHVKTVAEDFAQAKEQAKEIAKANRSRVIITRIKEAVTWKVYVIDSDTRQRSLVWEGLTKKQVLQRWKMWNEERVRAILIAVPSTHGKSF